jgi:hypothetical protein
MRAEYEKDKYNIFPSESKELLPTFNVHGKPFTMKIHEKRTPGKRKIESMKEKNYCIM